MIANKIRKKCTFGRFLRFFLSRSSESDSSSGVPIDSELGDSLRSCACWWRLLDADAGCLFRFVRAAPAAPAPGPAGGAIMPALLSRRASDLWKAASS